MKGSLWADQERAHAYALLGRDVCAYCGDFLPGTIEHMTPRSRGGVDEAHNLRVACASCNTSKGDRSLDEFRSMLTGRYGRPVTFWFETRLARAIEAAAVEVLAR